MNYKIIFLDIDGVLNSDEWIKKEYNLVGHILIGTKILDTKARDRLKLFLSENLDVKLVISSSWRLWDVKTTKEKFSIYYIAYRMWTPDGKLKLDIDNGLTNDYEWNLHIWTLHIDNDACESLVNVSIPTVEQFNLMMKVFENKFKICQ